MNVAMKISEAEWRVCQILWQHSPLTGNEIVAALEDKTSWNPRTIKTLLNRLVKKKVLRYESHSREYRYFPMLSEDECVLAQTQSFVKRIFGGAAGAMVATFLNNHQLSPREIAELRKILDQKAGKK
jgi:BlaI family transcriptional regulator, penicillinase repressor